VNSRGTDFSLHLNVSLCVDCDCKCVIVIESDCVKISQFLHVNIIISSMV